MLALTAPESMRCAPITGGMPSFQRLSGITLMPGTVLGSASTTPPLTSAQMLSDLLVPLAAVWQRELGSSRTALGENCVCRLHRDDT